ncbi:rRNA methyltransferase [Capnocytophaga sp. HP1101]
MTITSTQNPLIKKIALLSDKSRERKKQGLCVVEGAREIRLALQGSYTIETLLYQSDIFTQVQLQELLSYTSQKITPIAISKEVYEKITYRSSTEGVIALVQTKAHTLDILAFKTERPLLLVAEAPEKPGNIGALLRTADAAAIDAVIIANPKTDLYNPNIIRSSVGCVFTVPIATGTTEEVIQFLKEKHINTYCAALSASKSYYEASFEEASAIVVGTEDQGLTQEWLTHSTQNIIIPMEGVIDSMNVSVAAAVLIFEAKRQRVNLN